MKFMLDEMTYQNASKFAIFLVYENPHIFFTFVISCYLIFSLINDNIFRLGHSIGGKIMWHDMKNEKNPCGFSYNKNMANFEAFHQVIS